MRTHQQQHNTARNAHTKLRQRGKRKKEKRGKKKYNFWLFVGFEQEWGEKEWPIQNIDRTAKSNTKSKAATFAIGAWTQHLMPFLPFLFWTKQENSNKKEARALKLLWGKKKKRRKRKRHITILEEEKTRTPEHWQAFHSRHPHNIFLCHSPTHIGMLSLFLLLWPVYVSLFTTCFESKSSTLLFSFF